LCIDKSLQTWYNVVVAGKQNKTKRGLIYMKIMEKEQVERMELIMEADGNWELRWDYDMNCAFSIAVNPQCESTVFGNENHLRKYLVKRVMESPTAFYKLTELGRKILEGGRK